MGFNSGFKGLTASGFTLECGGSNVLSRCLEAPETCRATQNVK